MSRSRAAWLLTWAFLGPAAVFGAEEGKGDPSGFEREWRETLGFSLNPLGVQNAIEVSWKEPLFDSKRAILKDAHFAFGFANRLTPAYDRMGAWIQLSPLSILDLRAGIEPVAYFGAFKSLLPFAGYDAPFDSDIRKARGGEAEFALAGRVHLTPTLKVQLGRIIVRTRADFEWWKAWTDGPFFYEPTRDTLLNASGDAMMTGESVLLVEVSRKSGKKLLLGPVHDLTWVYDARQNRRQGLGLLAMRGVGERWLGLREPMVLAKVFYYLEDPSKKHEIGAQLAFGGFFGRAKDSR